MLAVLYCRGHSGTLDSDFLWRGGETYGESRRFRVSAFPDLVFPFVVLRLKLF